ncbi:MAG: aminotransferase class I/II-fold pyridoxal phosphate-dependent enzyme, partial [Eudoraea sp.]|nr:aminotransferase class I/II-fold pyridoxal phosphate-dependent enzyme [Eudoraea sp.]
LKNFIQKYNISTSFVDITNLEAVENTVKKGTKMIYCESVSNPLLEIADIKGLARIADKYGIPLVVDNTFSPLSIAPAKLGAHIVVHSLTKFINGTSDCVAGAVCGTKEFCLALKDVNNGAGMLLGSTLDSIRAASILKNMRTLHIRMQKHSYNAQYLSERFEQDGLRVVYPGLASHSGYELMKSQMVAEYGFGGIMTIDVGSLEKANALMELMQKENLGYLAVSLGFYKTLFSAPGTSTSSEIPIEEQEAMGLSDGLIRFSIGLDDDIQRTYEIMKSCMHRLDILTEDKVAL